MKQQQEMKKNQQEAELKLAIGKVFPDFDEKDLANKPLSVGNYKGKVVLVDFWATWCGPCVGELPNVLKTYEKYHSKGFEIVGISLDSDKTKLTSFMETKKMTWQQYFDGKGWGNKLAGKYGVGSIPATFLLDREGKIIAKNLRGEALEAEVGKILDSK
jgi:peroxiredoxin